MYPLAGAGKDMCDFAAWHSVHGRLRDVASLIEHLIALFSFPPLSTYSSFTFQPVCTRCVRPWSGAVCNLSVT